MSSESRVKLPRPGRLFSLEFELKCGERLLREMRKRGVSFEPRDVALFLLEREVLHLALSGRLLRVLSELSDRELLLLLLTLKDMEMKLKVHAKLAKRKAEELDRILDRIKEKLKDKGERE